MGAIYDLAFALLMVLIPDAAAATLGVPLATPRPYLWLIALLLGMLATVYALAAYDLRRFDAVPLVAGIGRLLGAAVFVVWSRQEPGATGLWALALADGFFGLGHLAARHFNRAQVAR